MSNEQTLVERLRSATMGFDWSDLPNDAEIRAVPLLREAADALTSQAAQITELQAEVADNAATIRILGDQYRAQMRHDEKLITDLKRALDTARKDGIGEAIALLETGYPMVPGESFRSDGAPSKNDKCAHGLYGYEACEACAIAALRALQTKDQAHDEG